MRNAIFVKMPKHSKTCIQKRAPKTLEQTQNIVFRAQEPIPYAYTKHAKTYKSEP
jgi:hypothetical protein